MAVTLLYPYCTLEQVQQFVGNTNADKIDQIKDAINRASRFIDEITGRIYYQKTVTDYYLRGTAGGDGWDIRKYIPGKSAGGLLVCKYKPIVSITSLVETAVALTENTDFYVLNESGIVERASGNWSETPRDIKITAVFGYATTDTATPSADQPGDITQYAIEIAGRMSGLFARSVEQQDGEVMAFYETAIPEWIVERLAAKAGMV